MKEKHIPENGYNCCSDNHWHNECGSFGGMDGYGIMVGGAISSIGLRGKSAYEIAVEHGYEGTEDEWIAQLQRPAGSLGGVLTIGNYKYNGTEDVTIPSYSGSFVMKED